MIIFGVKERQLLSKQLSHISCQACGHHGVLAEVFVKYFHIFWIPVFPFKKPTYLTCNACQATTTSKEMPDHFRNSVKELKRSARLPFWLFSGAVLFPALVAWVILSQEQATKTYFAQPQARDIYVMKIVDESDKSRYMILQVNEVEADSIVFEVGGFVYDNSYRASKAIRAKTHHTPGYFTERIKFARQDLDPEQIDKIVRPD